MFALSTLPDVREHKAFDSLGVFYEFGLADSSCTVFYVARWNNEHEPVMQILSPAINLGRVGDSLDAEIIMPIRFSGRGYLTFGIGKRSNFKPVSIPIEIVDRVTHFKLDGGIDQDNLYYHFDYTPAEVDSIGEIGVERKVKKYSDIAPIDIRSIEPLIDN